VTRDGLSQHPILVYETVAHAQAERVALQSQAELAALTAGLTSHGALAGVETQVVGRRLVLRLVFTTGDAIGINMAAQAADVCSKVIAERTGARERYVHGQDVEKRANARALIEGRVESVVAGRGSSASCSSDSSE
jgi:hydroxymethylglutaryl-CoA reductase (NADPH)